MGMDIGLPFLLKTPLIVRPFAVFFKAPILPLPSRERCTIVTPGNRELEDA
jgi:hypothetical protein